MRRLQVVRLNGIIICTYRSVREYAEGNRWVIEIEKPSCPCVVRAIMAKRGMTVVRIVPSATEGEDHGLTEADGRAVR